MPVDPDIRRLLDTLASQGTPALEDLSVGEARELTKSFGQSNRQLEDVASVSSDTVDGVPIRIYRRSGLDRDAPIFLWFHGGGFVVGDVDRTEPTARRLANRVPAAVVSVDYRLAPEHRYPAAIQDARTVLEWAVAERVPVAVGGDSAGANLAAQIAVEAREQDLALCHQALVYPWTDLAMTGRSIEENGEGYWLSKHTLRWFRDHYLGGSVDPRDPDASPAYIEDLSALAPATVITAEFDPLRDDGNRYAERLRRAGVTVELTCYSGMIHGFVGVVDVTPSAMNAIERVSANVEAALR